MTFKLNCNPKPELAVYYRKLSWPKSWESREIIGETETRKMDPRRDQSRGLESRLQALLGSTYAVQGRRKV